MKRRDFLHRLAAGLAAPVAGCHLDLGEGLRNPCRAALPRELAEHRVVRAAWDGIDPQQFWDCHVHVFGNGDSGGGAWFNPAMESLLSPAQFVQRLFYLNAGCAHDAPGRVDASVVERLHNQLDAMRGAKAMIMAFDWCHDEAGRAVESSSSFRVPDAYARDLARVAPRYFEWTASIHPYRPDAVDALERAAAEGAKAVKWLPAAQAIDPGSLLCDRFYRAAARLRLPVITHAGEEKAVRGGDRPEYGNPLRLRRALDAGVRVVVAHCASLGRDTDLDQGPSGPKVDSFTLFARLMDTPAYRPLLLADLSAVPQTNRADLLPQLLERAHWHDRLVNGSDYPLPGVMPLFSVDALVERGLLPAEVGGVAKRIREHNALLFDFVLKRHLTYRGRRFPATVFATRRQFER